MIPSYPIQLRLFVLDKQCPRCGETKPIDHFSINRANRDGRDYLCRLCGADARRKGRPVLRQSGKLALLRGVRCCISCNKEMPITEFYARTDTPGQRAECKACHLARAKRWFSENRRRVNARLRAQRAANPQRSRARDAIRRQLYAEAFRGARHRYYQRHQAALQAQRRSYYQQNAEAERSKRRAYGDLNRDEERRRSRAWYQVNGERARAAARAYLKAHPEKNRAAASRRRARVRLVTAARVDYAAIIARDGYHCYLCDRDVLRAELVLDHVIPIVRGGAHAADNLRVAHRLCNAYKFTMTPEEYHAREGRRHRAPRPRRQRGKPALPDLSRADNGNSRPLF